jgi:hypothetical protein
MSSAADAPGATPHAHDAHDAHDAFTGEPVDTLPADEPRTPGWLPLLGLGLFVSAGVYFLVTGDHPEGATQKLTPMELPAPPPQAVAQPAHVAPGGVPGPPGSDGLRKLNPQQMEDLRKKIEDARAKGAPAGQPAHP